MEDQQFEFTILRTSTPKQKRRSEQGTVSFEVDQGPRPSVALMAWYLSEGAENQDPKVNRAESVPTTAKKLFVVDEEEEDL